MEEDLLARIAALRASRRAGATAKPNDTNAAWLSEWIDHKRVGKVDSTHGYAEREHSSFDLCKLTVVSADAEETVTQGARDASGPAASVSSTFVFRFPAECSDLFINRNAPAVPHVLALSVRDTLRVADNGEISASLAIRWPCDLIFEGVPIATVVSDYDENLESDDSRFGLVIVTATLCLQAPNDEQRRYDSIMAPFKALTGEQGTFDVEAFRTKLASNFAAALRKFFVQGFAKFKDNVNLCWADMDQQIRLRVSETMVIEGTCMGVNDSGHLMVDRTAYPRGEIPRDAAAAEGVEEGPGQ